MDGSRGEKESVIVARLVSLSLKPKLALIQIAVTPPRFVSRRSPEGGKQG